MIGTAPTLNAAVVAVESLLAALGPGTSFRVAQEMVHRQREPAPRGGTTAASIGLTEAALARQPRAKRTSLDDLMDRVRRETNQLAGSKGVK